MLITEAQSQHLSQHNSVAATYIHSRNIKQFFSTNYMVPLDAIFHPLVDNMITLLRDEYVRLKPNSISSKYLNS